MEVQRQARNVALDCMQKDLIGNTLQLGRRARHISSTTHWYLIYCELEKRLPLETPSRIE